MSQDAYGWTMPAFAFSVMKEKVIQMANLVVGGRRDNPQRGRVYSTKGISPCINGVGGGGGNLEPKFLVICKPK